MKWKKDQYDKLYDQVISGKRTVCYVDYNWGKDQKPLRDICTVSPHHLQLTARGIGYGRFDHRKPEKEAFIEMCEGSNVEWLCESEQDEGWVPVERFAKWMDEERNKKLEHKDSLWSKMEIWANENACQRMLNYYRQLKEKPPATT